MSYLILVSAMLLAVAMWTPLLCIPPMEYILYEQLQVSHAQTSLLYNVPLWMVGAVALPAGLLADRIGFRKAGGIGATLIAVGSLLRCITTDFNAVLGFTFIYGIGFGFAFASLPKIISAWIPSEKTGIATGIYSAGIFIGEALAVSLTIPYILPLTNSVQGVFFVSSIPAMAAAVIWWAFLKETPHVRLETAKLTLSSNFFIQLLKKTLKNKYLLLLSIFHAMHLFFYYTWIGWAPALIMSKGATPETAGFVSSLIFWVAIPACFIIPWINQKIGIVRPFLLVPAIFMASAALMWFNISLNVSWLPMVLVGLADVTILITVLALPLQTVPKEEAGTAAGLILTAGNTGGPIGALVGGYIFDLTGGLNLALFVLLGISTTMIILSFRIPEIDPKINTAL